MFKSNWYWVLVVLIVLGIGSFVVFRPKAQVGTVKVYKTVTPAPKPTLTETSETDSLSDAQTQSLNKTAAVPPESETVETHSVDETEAQEGAPTEKNEVSDAAGVSESEKRYFGDYTEEELEQIRDWGKDLDARLMEKYPEFAALTRMTPEEIAEKYPTDKDRRQLAKLGQELLNEYTEEMGAFLVTLPAPIRTSLLNEIRSELSKNWGQKAADLTMEKLSDLMK